MARSILDLDNVDPADYDYPYGKVRDVSALGASDGTPVNEAAIGDVLQFFQKLMDEASVVPNGLPDNNYSGFQLFQALEDLLPAIKYRGNTVYTDGNNLPVTNISSTYWVANWPTVSTEIEILSNIFSDDIVSFGDEMPIGTTISISQTGQFNPINFVLNSTNAGGLPLLRLKGVTANDAQFGLDENETVIFTRKSHGWMGMQDTDT